MLNVLILNAPNSPPTEQSILIEPVDALTLATWIQHCGHQSVLMDLDRHGLAPLRLEAGSFDIAVLVYDYYIPLHTTAALSTFEEVFSLLAGRAERILLAGRMATYRPIDMLTRFPELDGCIVGEAEWTLRDLLAIDNWRELSSVPSIVTRASPSRQALPRRARTAKNIYSDGIPQSGPIANRALCCVSDYIDVRSIITSRGCAGVCRFCSTVEYWGAWRGAPPELVVAEMRHVRSFGGHKIIALDDNFVNDPQRVAAICALLKVAPIDWVWGCLCRIEDVSPQLLIDMVTAGCRWIHFGIEHGAPEVRAGIGKRFTNDQALDVIHFAKSLGLRIRTSWILDLPGSTCETIRQTFDLAKALGSHEIKLHFLAIRPGSTLYRILQSNSDHDDAKPRTRRPASEIFIHTGAPNMIERNGQGQELLELLHDFRQEMSESGYQWVDDVTFWRRYDQREAQSDERFLSTVVTRYGLGWV